MRPRTSSRVSPRDNVTFSISRSRRSRANPTSAAVPRGSRVASTMTSSPIKPMTTVGGGLQRLGRGGGEGVDPPLHQRVGRRIEVRAAHRASPVAGPALRPSSGPSRLFLSARPIGAPRQFSSASGPRSWRQPSRAAAAAGVPMRASASTPRSLRARSFFRQKNPRRPITVASAPMPASLGNAPQCGHRLEHDVVILAERLALVDDPDQHRHHARIALGDQRVDHRPPQFAGGGAKDGMDGAGRGRIGDRRKRRDRRGRDPRIRLAQERLQQRHALRAAEAPEEVVRPGAGRTSAGRRRATRARPTAAGAKADDQTRQRATTRRSRPRPSRPA